MAKMQPFQLGFFLNMQELGWNQIKAQQNTEGAKIIFHLLHLQFRKIQHIIHNPQSADSFINQGKLQ